MGDGAVQRGWVKLNPHSIQLNPYIEALTPLTSVCVDGVFAEVIKGNEVVWVAHT